MVANHTEVHAFKDGSIMAKSAGAYNSYLLRVWRDNSSGRTRFRLEPIGKQKEVLHFADLDSFIGYLLATSAAGPEFESQGDQTY